MAWNLMLQIRCATNVAMAYDGGLCLHADIMGLWNNVRKAHTAHM